MPDIIFEEFDGTRHEVAAESGESLMQVAINEMVPGIEGDCGGLCACGTCHVYIAPADNALCPPLEELEQNILQFAFAADESSRLACQIPVVDEMEGMVVRLPQRQY